MTESRRPKSVKLTKQQSARVRELVVDEGWPRPQAIAWVLTFDDGTAKGNAQ